MLYASRFFVRCIALLCPAVRGDFNLPEQADWGVKAAEKVRCHDAGHLFTRNRVKNTEKSVQSAPESRRLCEMTNLYVQHLRNLL